jgi:hypothetical protein
LNDCNLGLQIEELQDIYKSATEDEMSFLKIDVMSKDGNKMLSKNFSQFYEIE